MKRVIFAGVYSTLCWDIHEAKGKEADFMLLDVRSLALFAKGHIPEAINLPHGKIMADGITG